MGLRDFAVFGEPGAIVYLADCLEFMRLVPTGSVDAIFADPPYQLSTGGVTVKSGQLAPVDKGAWDRSLGSFEEDHAFNVRWLREARRILKPDGTIWVTGTHPTATCTTPTPPWPRGESATLPGRPPSATAASVLRSGARAWWCGSSSR